MVLLLCVWDLDPLILTLMCIYVKPDIRHIWINFIILKFIWIVFMFYYFCVKPCNSIEQIQLNLTVYEILSISHSLLINHTIEVFFKYFIIHINISLSQRSSSELKHLVSRVIKRILSKWHTLRFYNAVISDMKWQWFEWCKLRHISWKKVCFSKT